MINQAGYQALLEECAKVVIGVARAFQESEKEEWVQGPPRSKPGEHLRKDSGNAERNLIVTPTDPRTVAANLEVAVGYKPVAWYAAQWEMEASAKRRRGLSDKLKEFQKSGRLGSVTGSYQQ